MSALHLEATDSSPAPARQEAESVADPGAVRSALRIL